MRGEKFGHDYNSCYMHTNGHYVFAGIICVPVGTELLNIYLPKWVKILIILTFAGVVFLMLAVEQKMETIEEERNERKKY